LSDDIVGLPLIGERITAHLTEKSVVISD
jgi:hypothetical protein